MKYRVLTYFTDLQDDDHPYHAGDEFPRAGLSVDANRIKELSGTQNKRGIALIEEVRVTVKSGIEEIKVIPDEAETVENEPRKRTRKRKTEE